MSKEMGKYYYLFRVWIICYASSLFIVYFSNDSYKALIEFSFIVTFIGVLIGFSLTLFTHIVSILEKIKKEEKKEELLQEIYHEMKDDINVQFYGLLVILLMYIFRDVSYSIFSSLFNDKVSILTHIVKAKNAFILSVFFLMVLSIRDIITMAFKLSNHVLFKKDETDE